MSPWPPALLTTYYVQAEIAELLGDDELLNRELLQQLQAGGNPVVP
jgi:hypothetical protein